MLQSMVGPPPAATGRWPAAGLTGEVVLVGVGWIVVAVLAIGAVVYFRRHQDPATRARFLKRAGSILMGLFVVFLGLFIVGETIMDPGGWQAAGLITAWAAPLLVLAAIAWYRPGWAAVPLGVLTAGVVALNVWFAVAPEAWRSFEDTHGPIRTIASFALAAPVALLGWKRPAAAGVLLLVIGVVPVALSAIGLGATGLGFASTSLGVVSSPVIITGLLYLLAAAVSRHAAPPQAGRQTPHRPPKVA